MILSVDTTHEFGSIALLEGGEILGESTLHAPGAFVQILYGEIAALLDRHRLRVQDIDCFAAASGPGSFTGVRVGLACAKGLAEATGKPVAPVSNLRALATFGSGPVRATLIDARRSEIFGGLYDADWNAIAPEVVMKLEDWIKTLPAHGIEFISSDLVESLQVTLAPRAIAGAVGRIAEKMLRAGQAVDAAQADANYIRRTDAELLLGKP